MQIKIGGHYKVTSLTHHDSWVTVRVADEAGLGITDQQLYLCEIITSNWQILDVGRMHTLSALHIWKELDDCAIDKLCKALGYTDA